MKQIALSIEQMSHLKELGVDTSDASLIWLVNGKKQLLCTRDLEDRFEYGKSTPAYTLQDIWEKLPCSIDKYFVKALYSSEIYYEGTEDYLCVMDGDNSLEVCYKMLCRVAENHPEVLK